MTYMRAWRAASFSTFGMLRQLKASVFNFGCTLFSAQSSSKPTTAPFKQAQTPMRQPMVESFTIKGEFGASWPRDWSTSSKC